MTEMPRSRYTQVQGREVHYMEWGAPDAQPLVMWHGLARTGRDFDWIAARLADRFHIICPDTVGRGRSEWSDNPDADYCLDVYAAQARAVVDAAGFDRMYWLGTSMGGALGIRVAATTLRGRIDKLIINDIGPTFPEGPFERIKQYVGTPPEFSTMQELETYFRTIYEPFGYHTDAQWRHMVETSSRRLPSGKLTTHYDPAVVRQMFAHPHDYEQWEHYEAIQCPTLVLHGVKSDLLLPEIANEMTQRGPKAQVVEIDGCGHAPGLVQDPHIKLVRDWLTNVNDVGEVR
ncbi:MAG: pimeloyl-ACP methyl ester carboxylesterase [Gammaproteobacteria bacterium]|jgi:pimeloyl-ACP methyl ester carboxylesterase